MNDIRNKYVPPSVSETAFNCAHCGALAKQYWHSTHADQLDDDEMPTIWRPQDVDKINLDDIEDRQEAERTRQILRRLAAGTPQLIPQGRMRDYNIGNLAVSKCHNCDQLSIWLSDHMLWPVLGTASLPNPDIPDDVRSDYEEASSILDKSPRGAAALLRLAIQKLCKHLGETGHNINNDIAALVKKGLDRRVQQALDVVRVVGNNAVHPGQIDLKDDRATAEKLFDLVNLIAEIMITQPKHISTMYDGLPEQARNAIDRRDNNK